MTVNSTHKLYTHVEPKSWCYHMSVRALLVFLLVVLADLNDLRDVVVGTEVQGANVDVDIVL